MIKIETTNISQKDVAAFIFSDTSDHYFDKAKRKLESCDHHELFIAPCEKVLGSQLESRWKKNWKKIHCVRTITFSAVFPSVPFLFLTSSFFCVPGYWSTHWQSFMYLSPSAILRIQPPEFLEWTLWKFNKM